MCDSCRDLPALLQAASAGRPDLRVLLELGVEAFPGPLIGVGDGDVLQLGYALLEQGDAALEQRQHIVPEVEAFLVPCTCVRQQLTTSAHTARLQISSAAPRQPYCADAVTAAPVHAQV